MKYNNKQFLQHYNSNNLSNLFLEVTKQLRDMMPGKDIYYTRIYKEGSIHTISTNKEWLNKWLYYFNDFNGTLFQEKIKKTISSISNVYAAWNYSKYDSLLEFNHNYQIVQGFDIYKRKKDYVEMWAFSGSAGNPLFHDYCIDNITKLEEITSSHAKLLENYNDLFFAEKAEISLDLGSEFDRAFLTPRELECARLIIIGKTTKEIARDLNISPKTVEIYITNIKNKTNCHYKNDLIKSYRNLFYGDGNCSLK